MEDNAISCNEGIVRKLRASLVNCNTGAWFVGKFFRTFGKGVGKL